MRPDVLYHYSENPDIEVFHPRAPLRHTEEEPLVYTIDEWHSPLYYFPRDCPRVGIWPVESTSEIDRRNFNEVFGKRMLLIYQDSWTDLLEEAILYRYSFNPDGFEDTGDHGCWVSRSTQVPIECTPLDNLPFLIEEAGAFLVAVPDLVRNVSEAPDLAPFHVSMIRMSNLPNWHGLPGTPVRPKQTEPKE